jgi:hypothetical protein
MSGTWSADSLRWYESWYSEGCRTGHATPSRMGVTVPTRHHAESVGARNHEEAP